MSKDVGKAPETPRKGQKVSYEDMANPLREGTLTAIRISEYGEQYQVTWEDGETTWTDLRQRGWKYA